MTASVSSRLDYKMAGAPSVGGGFGIRPDCSNKSYFPPVVFGFGGTVVVFAYS